MRTRIFLDGMMLHRDGEQHGYDLDFKRLRGFYLPDEGETVAITFYNIMLIRQDGTSSLQKLIDWLENNGYRCRVIEVNDEERNSVRDARPELAAWMAAEILKAAENGAEKIIVWAADRALIPALRGAQEAGAVIEVVADPARCSSGLRRVADTFLDITEMRDLIKSEKVPA